MEEALRTLRQDIRESEKDEIEIVGQDSEKNKKEGS